MEVPGVSSSRIAVEIPELNCLPDYRATNVQGPMPSRLAASLTDMPTGITLPRTKVPEWERVLDRVLNRDLQRHRVARRTALLSLFRLGWRFGLRAWLFSTHSAAVNHIRPL